jgi:hypothetical protein
MIDTLDTEEADTTMADQKLKMSQLEYIDISADDRIDDLIAIKKEESLRKNGIDGFRVQIFQGTKDQAYQLKSKFLSKYTEYKVYVLFQTPDFKVRIGDFRSRSEAIKLKYLIESDFPNPFIVEDIINFPELKKKIQNK